MTDLGIYLPFVAPPLVGAFIGYLTNRIAIRMLFRPLRKWKIGPVGVPMTPGVIPSKRHELALNIGEMVGDHLLTSEEISKALRTDVFQDHLFHLIEAKVGSFLKKDLGSLSSLVSTSYKHYFDIGYKTLTYQVKETVIGYLHSPKCAELLAGAVEKWSAALLSRKLNDVLPAEKREEFYRILDATVEQTVSARELESSIESLV